MYLDVMKLRMKFVEHKKFGEQHANLAHKKAFNGRTASPGAPNGPPLTPQQQREAARREAMEMARLALHAPKKKKGESKANASPAEEAKEEKGSAPPVKTLGALLDGAFAGGLRSVADRSPTPAPGRRGGNAFVKAVLEAARAQAGLKPKSDEQSPMGGDASNAATSAAADRPAGDAMGREPTIARVLGSKSVWSALAKSRAQDTEVSTVSSKLQAWVNRAKKNAGDSSAASAEQEVGASEGRRSLFGSLRSSSPEITGEGRSPRSRPPPTGFGAGSSPELTVKLSGPIGATPTCPGRGSPYTPLRPPSYQQSPSPSPAAPGMSPSPSSPAPSSPPPPAGASPVPSTPGPSPTKPRRGPEAIKAAGGYAAAAAAARQAATRAPTTPRGGLQGTPSTPRTPRGYR